MNSRSLSTFAIAAFVVLGAIFMGLRYQALRKERAAVDQGNARLAAMGGFAGIALFLRQVMVELKKVVTPTRKELLSYTAVVLVFVVIMMALTSGFDLLFGWLVANVFGDGA